MCTLSGLPTEAGKGAGAAQMQPFVEHLSDCFGAERLMWESDWPALSASMYYDAWLRVCETLLANCDDAARQDIFGLNAARFHSLHDDRKRAQRT